MKKRIHKIFWIWESDKEEEWLNTMSAEGWLLCDVGLCRYTFAEGTPGEYQYRLELLDNWPSHPKSIEYLHFLEETGAEHIGSVLRWVYIRKMAGADGFDLFSDIRSRIHHLDRILFLAGIAGGLNFMNAVNCISRWQQTYVQGDMVMAALCCAVFLPLGYGFLRLFLQRNRLKRESLLHE